MSLPKITHVAIRFRGKIYSLPAPNRHHHVIADIVRQTGVNCVDSYGENQGFLDEHGNYLNRHQALINALDNKQVKNVKEIRMNLLFSEDVW